MKKFVTLTFTAFVLTGILFGVAFGESYPNGAEGIKCGTLPPPGFYYKMYNAYVTADDMIDEHGDELPLDFDAEIFVNVHRFLWLSKDIKIFGAGYGANIIIPIWYKSIEVGAFDYDDSSWELGDIIIEPIDLVWHGPNYDIGAAIAFFLPTGDHEELSDPGEDMYTTMFTLGGTYYPDKAKTWSFSLLARYEVHSEKRNTESRPGGWDTDLNPGDDFHFEWGIGKTLAKVWDVGLVGYAQFQVQHDHGTGADTHLEQAFGIGPEVSVFCTPLKTFFSLRSLWEFGVEGRSTGRPEGNRTFFVITKIL
jgi:hypothetical protein